MMALLLALLTLSILSSGASSVHIRSAHHVRQSSTASAHDTFCTKVMCIEAEVEGDIARYILRSTGEMKLGWMALGFGRMMADSAMVIMWPSRGEDGSASTVTLSQRKAPFETMPRPDPAPPFEAALELSGTSVDGELPQMAFTRPPPPDGIQDVIWAFSPTPPESAESDAHISIHHKFGRTHLNLTRTAASDDAPSPSPSPSPAPPPSPVPSPPEADEEDSHAANTTRPADAASESNSTTPADVEAGAAAASSGGFASFVHAGLCIVAFLVVIPSGALVARYAKVTGSAAAFDLHRNLQFGVAGACIAGGMLAYLFMDGDGGTGATHKWWGIALVLLYCVQCAVGFWVQRIPAERRTRVHGFLLSGLGIFIVMLAFFDAWLGIDAAGSSLFLWIILFIVVPSLYLVGMVVIQHRFRSVLKGTKGDYVALASRDAEGHEIVDARL